MSRTTNVVVLCPYGRRETVKVTQNSSVLQILEEACCKQNLNPDDFDLLHYNKVMDLSLPIRFANIPNNAMLELRPTKKAREKSLVTVCLQLESGERILNDFVPSTTVQNIIEQSLSSRSDIVPLQGTEPVCIYMRQQLVGDAIKNTSLHNLGLTKGKAIIRLLYRKPEGLDEQAHVSTPLIKPQVPEPLNISEQKCVELQNSTITEQNSMKQSLMNSMKNNEDISCERKNSLELSSVECSTNSDNYKNKRTLTEPADLSTDKRISLESNGSNEEHLFIAQKGDKLPDDQIMEVASNQEDSLPEDIGEIHYIGDRNAVLYSLEDITEVKKADLPDEFFELTINDVKYLMEEYRKTRSDLENQPLLTKEQRQRNILQKLGHYRQTVIRVYFPEKLVLQAVFNANETVEAVCDFVKKYLEEKDLNFYLYITPPKEKLNPSQTLLEALLVPAAVVYFGSESQRPNYLMGSLRKEISDPRAASLAAAQSRKFSFSNESVEIPYQATENVLVTENQDNVYSETVLNPSPQRPTHSGEKLPKWLKLSRK